MGKHTETTINLIRGLRKIPVESAESFLRELDGDLVFVHICDYFNIDVRNGQYDTDAVISQLLQDIYHERNI